MSGISVDGTVALLRGFPECLLSVLALHIFTRTKINPIKYFLLSVIYTLATFFVRFLPIALGVHSVLALLIMILTFQFIYQTQLSQIIRTIYSAAVVLILLALAEVANMVLLFALIGVDKTQTVLTMEDGLTISFYSFPSVVFLGLFVLIGYFILKKKDSRRFSHGEISENAVK